MKSKRVHVGFVITVSEAAPIDMFVDVFAALLKDAGFTRRAVAGVTVVDLDALAAVTAN